MNFTAIITAMSLILLAFPLFINAQAVSGVTGVVTDSAGAVIPGVDVKLTDTKTAKELTTKTNDQGVYIFSNVAPGEGYKLSFAIQNFQTFEISNVSLGVGKTETQNATLTAGNVGATVEVVAAPGDTLNTTDASIGNIIDQRQLRELPIQIRSSPAALIGLQPGVVGNNVGTGSTNRVGSVTGSRADQGNITVDGIDANDQATGQAFATVGNAPIDAIQEFRAITTNPNSSEGRSAGGQIELVTKSGTNDFHGSLYEYNRTAATAANSFFNNRSGIERPQLTRNQFGGSLGGPLPFLRFGELDPDKSFLSSGKDRLFFFFNYEGRRDARGVSYARIVPLDHYRNGGLGFINNNAGCSQSSRLNTTPQCITILTPAQVAALDPRGIGANQALLGFINNRYPRANDLTLGDGINTGGYRFNSPSKRADNTYTTRVDANITSKQKLFVRLNVVRALQTDTVNTVAQQFPQDPESGQIQTKDYSLAAGYSWVINDNLFNQFTVGNSRSDLNFLAPFRPAFPNIFTFGPISDPYADISLQNRIVDTPTIRDDLSWRLKSHDLQFGFSIKPIRSRSGLTNDFNFVTLGLGGNTDALDDTLRPGTIQPDTPTNTTATAAYDSAFAFLLGRYANISTNFNYGTNGQAFGPGTGKLRDFRYNEYEYYVQDNWKIRTDLTINLGLRYQYYPAPYEANGFQAANDVNLDTLFARRLANGQAGIGGDAAEPFLTYSLIGAKNNGRPYYPTDKNNFAPRLGFAYNPSFKGGILGAIFGDRKMVIRGGASKVYDRVSGALTFIGDQVSYLFDGSNATAFGVTDPRQSLLTDPRFTGIGTLPVQNTAPPISNPNTPFVSNGVPFGNAQGQTNYAIDQNFKTPFSYQYSFGIQREIPGNFLIDISYVGRKGRKLFTQADAAQIVDFRDNTSGQFLLSALNSVQSQLVAGVPALNVTNQAFLENQMNAAALANYGGTCAQVFGLSCTRIVSRFFGSLVRKGDASDTVQALFANGLLNSNVGLSGQFSTNAYVTNLGKSEYNGLLVSLQKRFSQGYQFDFNYTYSHSLDNNSSVANTVFGGLICDLRNPDLCRGPSDFDIRHLINVNGIWELPFGRGKFFGKDMSKFWDAFVGGFQLSGIFTYRSGLPFNPNTGSFPVGFVLDSPAVLTGNSSALATNLRDVNGNIQLFADATAALAAFRNPRNGEVGNRNVLRGPSFWNLDLGLQKNFRMPWENTRLQIRADAFNVFNHNVFGLPDANINGTTFGRITTTASAPRELQFAVRFDF
ncbi:MAG: TonB-dependent receptor [Acidobacteria bacterium]|nr:TonB-dependent receptor [Acidobacteriota bacterium]